MSDPQELKGHIRWLEDELSAANNIDGDLENIDGALTEIKSDLGNNTDALKRLCDTYNTIAGSINQNTETLNKLIDCVNGHSEVLRELVNVLAPKPPPAPADILNEFFANAPDTTNKPKAPKPRKTKLSVVPKKDGDDGPGTAP